MGEDNSIKVGNIEGSSIGHIGHVRNEAPEPELRYSSPVQVANEDGTVTISVIIEIVSPYPPAQLYLVARAEGIQSMEAGQQRVGMQMTGHSGCRDGYCFTTLMQPFGRYKIVVRAQRGPIRIEYEFA